LFFPTNSVGKIFFIPDALKTWQLWKIALYLRAFSREDKEVINLSQLKLYLKDGCKDQIGTPR
jgi:hypothetical protein